MVRATEARVLVRLGATAWPVVSWTQAAVTALCTQADYIIDGYTYPDTISTTSNTAIELAVDVVLRMMRMADMMQEAGGSSSADGRSYTDFEILNEQMRERISALLRSSDYRGITIIDLIEDDE
jgi:hypothetical protein